MQSFAIVASLIFGWFAIVLAVVAFEVVTGTQTGPVGT
jgi:hypothetical protein